MIPGQQLLFVFHIFQDKIKQFACQIDWKEKNPVV